MIRLDQDPHRRYNPLTREWVLVSPHRTHRPWQGQVEKTPSTAIPAYDPNCYLCPGNERAGGARNPNYDGTFVFDNDYAALKPDTSQDVFETGSGGLIRAIGEPGICRVVCFSPRHDLTLPTMSVSQIESLVTVWQEQLIELGTRPSIRHVQIFENRGALMGASNPHPHCQIWATAELPNEVAKEQKSQMEYSRRSGCLLCDYLEEECAAQERMVFQNKSFTALVPFWAVWPFETMVLPNVHRGSISQFTAIEVRAFAETLKLLTSIYDRVFDAPFAYSMGFHQAPTDDNSHPEWHMHAHFYPPLLRSATVRKFMVGFEMLGTPQRDITAESAAARLRELL